MEGKNSRFEQFKLNKQLLNAIAEAGFDRPTPIQEKVITQALAGQDIMGIAQTGTGKTAAYLIPLLMKLKYAQGSDPRTLIFAPTRELVLQIFDHFKQLSPYLDIRAIPVYGGIGPKIQIEEIEKGIDLIIATPGRFMDLYKRNVLKVKNINTLVLDEADRMMDMGFMPQIRNILEVIPVKRQNLLFSATMPERVVKLSEEFLENPQVVEVTRQATAAETVKQELYHVPNLKTKINLLKYLLEDPSLQKVIVFTRTKANADNVFKYIDRKQIASVRVIHANKGQNSRINAVKDFEDGNIRVLVSTDVTARGIDIADVTHVINFDVPILYEDYVHRIGRTGRARKEGKAITMANQAEEWHIRKIEGIIRQQIPVKKLPASVKVEETPFEEKQEIAKELDHLKMKEDPDYKGAFHEKKKKFTAQHKPKKKKRKR
jgi:ATP-dependent RNA helicase RhlE